MATRLTPRMTFVRCVDLEDVRSRLPVLGAAVDEGGTRLQREPGVVDSRNEVGRIERAARDRPTVDGRARAARGQGQERGHGQERDAGHPEVHPAAAGWGCGRQ